MQLLEIIKKLEGKSDHQRSEFIEQTLIRWGIPYEIHPYATGRNILLPSGRPQWIGISSHFDVVKNSPGANDNASAIAVCLDLIRRNQIKPLKSLGIGFFFFDEEERNLKGSTAYVKQLGINGMTGLINLEMVGQGDRLALWSLTEKSKGRILKTLESTANAHNIFTRRFDRIVTNQADHMSFQKAGLVDAFTVTCISEKDIEVAWHYYKAQEFDVDQTTLWEIITQAPLFKHYHQPSDLSEHLSEESLQMTSNIIWQTLLALDK
ncbi:M28 family metallopeptidase [Xanthocytophaga flava]|uniref:M28 family metallopeptidase n=1 Tax=Xanthocytophaga flava TaxID=3048013 RepID=UPI0028D80093|nr:M28 family peptidase [Xanthocytophaga flavus]MDJ1470144.1 M28 family peptidase [Xanthocytophaga flavus]